VAKAETVVPLRNADATAFGVVPRTLARDFTSLSRRRRRLAG
jgi:hypothetical protein